MATSILIVGESGTGKSTSGRTLPAGETYWFNVLSKPLPFKGWKARYTPATRENPQGNLANTSKFADIARGLAFISEKRPEIKYVVIDDLQHAMSSEYLNRLRENGFQKFNDILGGMHLVFEAAKNAREDLVIFLLMHPETDLDASGNRITRVKTIGKAIEKYMTVESLFTVVLFTRVRRNGENNEYLFTTQTDGTNTAKSPEGVFPLREIPNDLLAVAKAVQAHEYE